MKKRLFGIIFLTSILLCAFSLTSDAKASVYEQPVVFTTRAAGPIIANHTVCDLIRLDQINDSDIINAKNSLHIAYGHTSHGSQVITGMSALPAYKESLGGTVDLYDWNEGGSSGALDIDDYFVGGDLGNPDYTTWAGLTRTYLENPANDDVNVVMWSWCGEVSGATEENIDTYLSLMTSLENDFTNVSFVYMTGHTDGSGLTGNLHIRNNQIRDYCTANNKILYDFADIESYDPTGSYFGDKDVNDNCDYDSDGNGSLDGNWATEWQDGHPGEWYVCSPAHTQPLNGNLKAYAAWWLWASLSGWNGTEIPIITPTPTDTPTGSGSFTLPFAAASIGIVTLGLMVMSIAYTVYKRRK